MSTISWMRPQPFFTVPLVIHPVHYLLQDPCTGPRMRVHPRGILTQWLYFTGPWSYVNLLLEPIGPAPGTHAHYGSEVLPPVNLFYHHASCHLFCLPYERSSLMISSWCVFYPCAYGLRPSCVKQIFFALFFFRSTDHTSTCSL